jgi:hypothetical protein
MLRFQARGIKKSSSGTPPGEVVRHFSVVSTLGTPIDVTSQELRLESFFPSDDATRDAWHEIVDGGH